MKKSTIFIAILSSVCLLLSACGLQAGSAGAGGEKWIASDIAGSIKETDRIRPQDDFAAAVNRDWSLGAEPESSAFMDVTLAVMDKKQQILDRDYTDHDGQELKKFYDLAADWDRRDRAGVEPLRPWLESIEAISSLEDLTAYVCDRERNPLGLGILMPREAGQSMADPAVCQMTIDVPSLLLGGKDEYFNLDQSGLERQEYVRRVAGHIFSSLGYPEDQVRRLLKDNYRFEKKIADTNVELPADELKSLSLSFDECTQALPDYPLAEILDGRGIPRDGKFFMKVQSAKRAAALYREQNLDQIKAMMMVHLAVSAARWLDRPTYDLGLEAGKSRLNEEAPDRTPEDRREQGILQSYVMESALAPVLDRIYVDQYAEDLDTKGLSSMTDEIIAVYRELFAQETWLSEDGRQACLDKLEALAVHIVRPDFEMVSYDGLSIRSAQEGGSFLEAMLATERFRRDYYASLLTIPCDRTRWDPLDPLRLSTTETNAVYVPQRNGIYIFAGALEPPVYSPAMSREQVLGGIGAIVAHEITHGFDVNGSHYNKEGEEENWLPTEDQMAFSDRCDRVAQYYRTIHPYPGSGACDGQRVTAEATADMGGLRATLAVGAKQTGFDCDAYFRQFASIWASSFTKDTVKNMFSTDVHPLPFLRVNVGVQQFEEFYRTYGVREGDGMYLPEDQRIAVW